ncbi:hypothetical protein LIA77_01976 [Sarocladium implicatum]|nr:hypothetical protein LIA77_01976 [Sarocladium implicatum]
MSTPVHREATPGSSPVVLVGDHAPTRVQPATDPQPHHHFETEAAYHRESRQWSSDAEERVGRQLRELQNVVIKTRQGSLVVRVTLWQLLCCR